MRSADSFGNLAPSEVLRTECSGTLPHKYTTRVCCGLICALELGRWTESQIDALLEEMGRVCRDASERAWFAAQALLGTPFFPESKLPLLPPNVLRIRLQTLDCVTFVYTVLALAAANNFDQFARHLYALRYHDSESGRIDSDPENGNIYDFVEESLLRNAVERGYLDDLTKRVAGETVTEPLTADLRPRMRDSTLDPDNRIATPKYQHGPVTADFIPGCAFDCLKPPLIRSGDCLLLTRGPKKHPEYLIQHCAIAHAENDDIFMIHSTKQFAWRPDATHETEPSHTGIYYEDDPRKEQLGVSFSGQYVGDHLVMSEEGVHLFGYNQAQKRSVKDYALGCDFNGVKVLRPLRVCE